MIQVSPLLVAQVTDIHLFADSYQELLGMPTTDSFQALLEQLSRLSPQPDLLLLTGDLSQDGTPKSYRRLQEMLAPLGRVHPSLVSLSLRMCLESPFSQGLQV